MSFLVEMKWNIVYSRNSNKINDRDLLLWLHCTQFFPFHNLEQRWFQKGAEMFTSVSLLHELIWVARYSYTYTKYGPDHLLPLFTFS